MILAILKVGIPLLLFVVASVYFTVKTIRMFGVKCDFDKFMTVASLASLSWSFMLAIVLVILANSGVL